MTKHVHSAAELAALDIIEKCGGLARGPDGYWYGTPARTISRHRETLAVTPQLIADLIAAGAVEIIGERAKLRRVAFALT